MPWRRHQPWSGHRPGGIRGRAARHPVRAAVGFVVRGRILYRGAWGRAIRRGLLAGGAVAALGGLRLGGALTVPVAIFVVLLAGAVEWLSIRRFDVP